MEEIIQSLTDLGLTSLQARVLYNLQKLDNSTVKSISKASDVHRQQIYPVLTELQKMGFIQKQLGRPNKYKSLALDHIFTVLLENKAKWMADIKQKTSELTKKINTERKESDNDEYSFRLINGKAQFKHELRDWSQNAHTIDMVIKFDALSKHLETELEANKIKHRDDVKYRLITDAAPENSLVTKCNKKGYKIKFSTFNIPVEIAVFNNSRAHLAIFSSRDNVYSTDVACLTSNHPCFVAMLQSYFETLWKAAKPKKLKKEE
ncbi:MAG: hypothetical protein CW691_08585 [Candidatus Bathyarchaeum sp.]|nr:MAG: hypothetical protein CW691_08585 [Candidatus Bathyarchaeum sp.]